MRSLSIYIVKHTPSHEMLPIRVKRDLTAFGANIAIARKRRGVTTAMMAERLGVGRDTYARVEKGSVTVSLGIYAMALFALGLEHGFAKLADPQTDDTGTMLDINRLPKRVRTKRDPQPT